MRSTNASGTVVASKLMAKSNISADDIARQVFEESANGRFMILTHKTEKRVWMVKRFIPSLYFKMIKSTAKKFNAKMSGRQA